MQQIHTGKFADYIKKRRNYFVEHLLGKKAFWEFSMEKGQSFKNISFGIELVTLVHLC